MHAHSQVVHKGQCYTQPCILHTLSLGLRVRRMISAASNSLSRPSLVRKLLFFTINTTSFGLGVAEAMYHGLRG